MPDQIYVDPSVGTENVIRVGGQCYAIVGPSSMPPDTFSVDATFDDCASCEDNGCPCRRVKMHIVAYTDSSFTTVCWEGDVDTITCPDNNGLQYGYFSACYLDDDPTACPPSFELYDSGGGPSPDPSACFTVSLRFGGNWTQTDITKCDGTPYGTYPDHNHVCDNLGGNCMDITDISVEQIHYCIHCCDDMDNCPDTITVTVAGAPVIGDLDPNGTYTLSRDGCEYADEFGNVASCYPYNDFGGGYKWDVSVADGNVGLDILNTNGCPPNGQYELPCGGTLTIGSK